MPDLHPATRILSEQEAQIRQRSAAFVGIGVPTLIYFGTIAAFDNEPLLAVLALGTAVVVTLSAVLLWRYGKAYSAIRPAVFCHTILVLYLVAYSGPEHARGLWFLSLPLVAIKLLPPREGGAWALAAIIAAASLMFLAVDGDGATAYSRAYITRFTVTATLIGGVLFWSELLLQRYQLRLEGQNAALAAERDQLEREIVQRTALEEELRYLATTDALTGLLNRRAFLATLAGEQTRSQRLRSRYTLLMLDIDHFKQVNDTWGHPAGDAVLVHLASLLSSQLRTVDRLGRIGGEEFAILLTDTPADGASGVVERLLQTVRRQPASHPETGAAIPFTVSIGCTESRPDDDEQAAIVRADRALYAAKQGGRDQHCWR